MIVARLRGEIFILLALVMLEQFNELSAQIFANNNAPLASHSRVASSSNVNDDLIRLIRDTSKSDKKKSGAKGQKGETGFRNECLAGHNKWRRLHGVPELKIDEKLTKYAQKRADFIAVSDGERFEHVQDNPYGENLAWHSNKETPCVKLTGLWYDEINEYDFKNPAFTLETGHFTQMIWRASTRLGCARQTSQGPQGGVYLVCIYDPPGNFVNEFAENVPAKLPGTVGLASITTTPSTPTTTGSSRSGLDNLNPAPALTSSIPTGVAEEKKEPTAKPKTKKKNKGKKNKKKKNKSSQKKKMKKKPEDENEVEKRKRDNKSKRKGKKKEQTMTTIAPVVG